MHNKIYQVWYDAPDYTTICFASTSYTATVDYVVSIIRRLEDEHSRTFAAKCRRKDAELATLNAQVSALQSISDNDAIKPILNELLERQEMETTYAEWRNKTDASVQSADYYKNRLDKYCSQYGIAIIDFDADTEIHVDVQSCIDEVVP